jgi:hypothetical protein
MTNLHLLTLSPWLGTHATLFGTDFVTLNRLASPQKVRHLVTFTMPEYSAEKRRMFRLV